MIILDMNELIKRAMEFSCQAHKAQQYSSIYPYFKHNEDVYKVLLEFGFSEDNPEDIDLLVAAWLHDAIEDTPTSYTDIKKVFDVSVAEIVYCVTDEMGRNRKEKKFKTYPKICTNPKSIILKVADRIVNTRFSKANGTSQYQMYKDEYLIFSTRLRPYIPQCMKVSGDVDKMWQCLDDLYRDEAIS